MLRSNLFLFRVNCPIQATLHKFWCQQKNDFNLNINQWSNLDAKISINSINRKSNAGLFRSTPYRSTWWNYFRHATIICIPNEDMPNVCRTEVHFCLILALIGEILNLNEVFNFEFLWFLPEIKTKILMINSRLRFNSSFFGMQCFN